MLILILETLHASRFRNSSSTAWMSIAVLPLFLGLPLNATTFMLALLSTHRV
jgi:hypothetical protein